MQTDYFVVGSWGFHSMIDDRWVTVLAPVQTRITLNHDGTPAGESTAMADALKTIEDLAWTNVRSDVPWNLKERRDLAGWHVLSIVPLQTSRSASPES